jgi:hypothetical protein
VKGSKVINPGAILIEKGTALPPSFRLENNSYPSAWMSVANNGNGGAARHAHDLESKLAATGWTFFYMAGEVTANACGFDRQKTVHKAVERLIAGAKRQNFNCLEIDKVAMHSFLGMPYASVSAHVCHIQESSLLSRTK